jgi:hypothetical protein
VQKLEQKINPSNSQKQVLNEEAQRKLAEITAHLENRGHTNSKFIKFKDGERKSLHFIPEKTSPLMVTYPNSPDKPMQRYKFYVYDLTANTNSEEEKEWTVGSTVAKQLLRWIGKGYTMLYITRHGIDLKTVYDIEPQLD